MGAPPPPFAGAPPNPFLQRRLGVLCHLLPPCGRARAATPVTFSTEGSTGSRGAPEGPRTPGRLTCVHAPSARQHGPPPRPRRGLRLLHTQLPRNHPPRRDPPCPAPPTCVAPQPPTHPPTCVRLPHLRATHLHVPLGACAAARSPPAVDTAALPPRLIRCYRRPIGGAV